MSKYCYTIFIISITEKQWDFSRCVKNRIIQVPIIIWEMQYFGMGFIIYICPLACCFGNIYSKIISLYHGITEQYSLNQSPKVLIVQQIYQTSTSFKYTELSAIALLWCGFHQMYLSINILFWQNMIPKIISLHHGISGHYSLNQSPQVIDVKQLWQISPHANSRNYLQISLF